MNSFTFLYYLYYYNFFQGENKVKAQNLFRSYITKVTGKSSRKKQKLYEKCLKNRKP